MPVEVTLGRNTYAGDNKLHAEEVMFNSGKFPAQGNVNVSMNAWPCTGERHHNCHQRFIERSAGRTITISITGDHAGYAANHGKPFGATGTITYTNGVAVIS